MAVENTSNLDGTFWVIQLFARQAFNAVITFNRHCNTYTSLPLHNQFVLPVAFYVQGQP